jgi:hypothetical protein
MTDRFACQTSRFLLTSATLFCALATVATLCAHGPGREPDGGPVRKELDEFREKSSQKAPPERLRAYEQGIEEVRKSGVTEKALKVGDQAPDFELANAAGKKIKLSELTARGPVVLTWYRGGWCPYCNIALRGFHKSLPEIRAACDAGRPFAGNARQHSEHCGEEPPRIRGVERSRKQGRARLRRRLQDPQGHRRPVQGASRPGQA